MAFPIGKNLEIKVKPFQRGIDLIILDKVSSLLGRNDLQWVDYREVRSTKPLTRKFNIISASNLRDK